MTASKLRLAESLTEDQTPNELFEQISDEIKDIDFGGLATFLGEISVLSREDDSGKAYWIEFLTVLNDRRYSTGSKKRSSVLTMVRESLYEIFRSTSAIDQNKAAKFLRVDFGYRNKLGKSAGTECTLIVDASDFASEGEDSLARFVVKAKDNGWRRLILYDVRGQRFIGSGLGAESSRVRVDVYGSAGDYLASGLFGAEICVHDNAQDQVANIMKAGRVVVYGDVGQTFMYGSKGGEAYVMGNAAGRPVVFSVGRPRVVINGTALDYLAESFMAGDPLKDGGFIIVNGVSFDNQGNIIELPEPYPGGNLASLCSGGAVYIRDPNRTLGEDQLNGGRIVAITELDWNLIRSFLEANERLFGITLDELLTVHGTNRPPEEVYRKVESAGTEVLKTAHH